MRDSGYHSVAEAVGAAPRRASVRPRTRRRDVVLTLTATAMGLWFGLAAPSASPVAPPTSAISSLAFTDQAPVPTESAMAMDPGVPVNPGVPADPAGPGRRDSQLERFDPSGPTGRHR